MNAGERGSSPPLVFACAGCSPAGRTAYEVAQRISSRGDAEMSCLAGVAAQLPHFERQAADRELWVVDGCPLECAMHVLRNQGREVARHIRLHDHGIKKRIGLTDGQTVEQLTEEILSE